MKRDVALEDVLDAFSMEESISTQTLERYLRAYPQYVEPLSDLFHEIRLVGFQAEANRAVEIKAASALSETEDASDTGRGAEPLFSKENIKRAAGRLGVSRAFLTGFRDRLIEARSVPKEVLKLVADALGRSEQTIKTHLQGAPSIGTAVAFKAKDQPRAPVQIPFETYLEGFPEASDQLAGLIGSDGRD